MMPMVPRAVKAARQSRGGAGRRAVPDCLRGRKTFDASRASVLPVAVRDRLEPVAEAPARGGPAAARERGWRRASRRRNGARAAQGYPSLSERMLPRRKSVLSSTGRLLQICGVVRQLKSDHWGINAQNPCDFSGLFAVQILAVQSSLLSSALPSKYACVRDAWRPAGTPRNFLSKQEIRSGCRRLGRARPNPLCK
jgi:hypothetical protein